MLNSKEQFLKSTQAQLDKNLQRQEDYHKYKIESYKRFWRALPLNPITHLVLFLIAIPIVALGFYCDWNFKKMIDVSFGYILTSLITGMIEYLVIKSLDKNDKHNT